MMVSNPVVSMISRTALFMLIRLNPAPSSTDFRMINNTRSPADEMYSSPFISTHIAVILLLAADSLYRERSSGAVIVSRRPETVMFSVSLDILACALN